MEFWMWILICFGAFLIGFRTGYTNGYVNGIDWYENDYDSDELGDDE